MFHIPKTYFHTTTLQFRKGKLIISFLCLFYACFLHQLKRIMGCLLPQHWSSTNVILLPSIIVMYFTTVVASLWSQWNSLMGCGGMLLSIPWQKRRCKKEGMDRSLANPQGGWNKNQSSILCRHICIWEQFHAALRNIFFAAVRYASKPFHWPSIWWYTKRPCLW